MPSGLGLRAIDHDGNRIYLRARAVLLEQAPHRRRQAPEPDRKLTTLGSDARPELFRSRFHAFERRRIAFGRPLEQRREQGEHVALARVIQRAQRFEQGVDVFAGDAQRLPQQARIDEERPSRLDLGRARQARLVGRQWVHFALPFGPRRRAKRLIFAAREAQAQATTDQPGELAFRQMQHREAQ